MRQYWSEKRGFCEAKMRPKLKITATAKSQNPAMPAALFGPESTD
jgi:hypothetical protein